MVENYEPLAWVEELIEPARAVDHPRLAALYVMASQCWLVGRVEEAVRYSDAGQTVIASGRDEVPSGVEGWLGACTWASASPTGGSSGAAPCSHAVPTPTQWPGQAWSLALTIAGSGDEARAAANGLIDAAEATRNPCALSYALLAYGIACRDADPVRAQMP